MSDFLLTRVVAASVQVARKAARIIREIKKSGNLGIKEKDVNDYVTDADVQAQLCIVRSLQAMFPKLRFVGEEGNPGTKFDDIERDVDQEVLKLADNADLRAKYGEIKEEDLIIWVDPIDGTSSYVAGEEKIHEVTTLIGISWKGEPIAGVMNQPFSTQKINDSNCDRMIWAICGLGAFEKGVNDKVYRKMEKNKNETVNYTVVTNWVTKPIEKCISRIPNCEVEVLGGAGYKTLRVIDGCKKCYVYSERGTKRWDTCAGDAVLRSLGGKYTDCFGGLYDYSYPSDDPDTQLTNSKGVIGALDNHELFINALNLKK